ncbi:hypothetical protein Celaphus_00006411 [Cervus elaphus hippelaphus]|uniref:Uncharacterized protein n=1 Tax=Cervus elaphus hippelaphus TaxID=46360 RepID=A0A212CT90_CEREH|nr:hypothetical protein Celaphus_00006411 [Cervus elaphus hippelaphus]
MAFFETTVGYFGMKPKSGEKEITPNYVFMVWYEFCSDFKTIWKRESKNISKERLKMAQESVSKLTAEKKVETKKINPTASLTPEVPLSPHPLVPHPCPIPQPCGQGALLSPRETQPCDCFLLISIANDG